MERNFNLTVRQRHNLLIDLDIDSFRSKDSDEQWFLLRSDAHQDNPLCNRELEMKHLEEAKESKAIILDNGDLFCAMEGKGDPRGSKKIRPEHIGSNYLDLLVKEAANRYEPYAHLWALMAMGNHEASVNDRRETNLTDRLASVLTDRTGHKVQGGGICNWVTIRMTSKCGQKAVYRIYMHHGYGGGGPVTLDVIQGQRKAASVEGADLYVSGHTHGNWTVPRYKTQLSPATGLEEMKEVQMVKLPTYKDEFFSTEGRGFHHIKGRDPKPLGAYWLCLKAMARRFDSGKSKSVYIDATLTPAK